MGILLGKWNKMIDTMQTNDFLITFKWRTSPGKKVCLLADFLSWKPMPMKDENGDGTYIYRARLKPGDYHYQYQVDDKIFDDPFCDASKINEKTGVKYSIKHVYSSRSDIPKIKAASNIMSSVLEECRKSAKIGENQAQNALKSVEESLSLVLNDLRNSVSHEIQLKSVDETTKAIRKEFDEIEKRFGLLPIRIREELKNLKSHKSDFSIVLFGRTMAGKSTLKEFLTNGAGDSIGKGRQRTTRDVRSYNWNGLEIIDVPGVCAADGGDDEGVALEAVKHADLVLFLITDDAPTPSEAKFLNLVRSMGKPVLGILNVKLALDDEGKDAGELSNKDIEYFLHELKEQMTENHCKGIEDQFNEFLQQGASGAKVYFIPVHLLAGFSAKKIKDNRLATRMLAASNVTKLEDSIKKTIMAHGCEYRLKSFLDTVIRPLQDFAMELYRQSLLSGGSGRLVLQKKRSLLNWKAEYEETCRAKIKNFIMGEQRKIQESIPDFAEQYYEDSSAGTAWNNKIKNIGLNAKSESLCRELQDSLRKKLEDLNKELKFEVEFSAPTVNISPSSITDWKRIWNWSGSLVGAGLAIAAFWWNPAGWIAAGVGIFTWLGSLFFDDREAKRKRARNELENKLRNNTVELFKKLDGTLTNYLDKDLLEKQFTSAVTSMSKVIDALFKLSEQQRQLAGAISDEIVKMNGILVDTILHTSSVSRNVLPPAVSIGRIPGEITMVLLPEKIKNSQDVSKLLGTSLKETVRFVVSCNDTTWHKIRKILGLSLEDGKANLRFEEKINVAHLASPNGCLTPEVRARILLAQQLTKIAIEQKETLS